MGIDVTLEGVVLSASGCFGVVTWPACLSSLALCPHGASLLGVELKWRFALALILKAAGLVSKESA